jgi:hypothetical protein
MKVTQEHQAQIEGIINGMECSKDFECYKSGFENLCKVRIFRNGELSECLDTKSWLCPFSFNFGNGYYCKCPLRKYIAKHFYK